MNEHEHLFRALETKTTVNRNDPVETVNKEYCLFCERCGEIFPKAQGVLSAAEKKA